MPHNLLDFTAFNEDVLTADHRTKHFKALLTRVYTTSMHYYNTPTPTGNIHPHNTYNTWYIFIYLIYFIFLHTNIYILYFCVCVHMF